MDRFPRAVLFGSIIALSVGCSEPNFDTRLDASVPTVHDAAALRPTDGAPAPPAVAEARPDAGAQAPDPVPLDAAAPDTAAPWYDALAKHYAISVRFYGKDRGLADQALYSHELIMKATITVDDAGKVTMETLRCRDHGNVLGLGFQDEFNLIHPELLPVQSLELQLRPEGLRSAAPARPMGYEPVQTCSPGTRMRVDNRPWLPNDTCTCRADALPVLADDCRIIDADGDGRAGLSIQHMGLRNDIEPVRSLDNSQIVNGTLAQDGRIRASFIEYYDSMGLDCGSSPCTQAVIAVCPLMLNRVLFEPIADLAPSGESWDCAALLGELDAGKLFPLEMLTFVSGC